MKHPAANGPWVLEAPNPNAAKTAPPTTIRSKPFPFVGTRLKPTRLNQISGEGPPEIALTISAAAVFRLIIPRPYPIRTPIAPSTGRIAPEMNFASSEARKSAA